MYTVTVRDHVMVAHSLRGEVFGPAQQMHGATFVVEVGFRRESLDEHGIVVDLGLAGAVVARVLDGLRYRNLDEHPDFAGRNSTTEVLAAHVADEVVEAARRGDLGEGARSLAGVHVLLRESPDAWASYERSV